MRDALKAVLALAPAPNGFTVAEFTAKVHAMTGTSSTAYSSRQAAYDLRKIRGKQLVDKPARSRHQVFRRSGRPAARHSGVWRTTTPRGTVLANLASSSRTWPESV
jgi:hypothetical protein